MIESENNRIYVKTNSGNRIISTLNAIIPIVSIFMLVYLPTSSNGEIYSSAWMIFVWSIAAIIGITLLVISKKKNYIKMFLILLSVTLYLLIITIIVLNLNIGARISIARIAPVIALLILFTLKIRCEIKFTFMSKLVDVFFITMIIWNSLIVLDVPIIEDFTTKYYSQYYQNALFYSLYSNKPVMSFGVHTYASYIYIFFFYMSYHTAIVTNRKRNYFYCIAAIVFTFMLTSNSSLIYAIIMSIMYLRLIKNKPFFTFGVIILGVLVLAYYSSFIIENYKMISQSNLNGFIARYFGENIVFRENIEYLKNYYAVGFNIIDRLNYSDSGYMLYLTMGNVPLLVIVYYLVYKFFKNNLRNRYSLFIIFIVLSFEVALPATFNYRFFYIAIFTIYYFRSLDAYKPNKFSLQ